MSSVEALLGAQEPLGPKEIKPEEVRKDEDVYYSSKPFEWPEHMAVSGSQ